MPEESRIALRFLGGAADTKDLEAEVSSVLQELGNPRSGAAEAAKAAGLNPTDVAGAHVSVVKDAKGFGVVEIVVAITVPVGIHIVNKFWDEVIWPHVKNRLGADALGRRRE